MGKVLYSTNFPVQGHFLSSEVRRPNVSHGRGKFQTFCQVTTSKEGLRGARKENVPGEFYVDHTCIDCDTCRWMAPEIYHSNNGMSAVYKQPDNKLERTKALQALLACPTASIHVSSPPKDISEVHATFPLPIDESSLPGVFHCGYHSKKSYGATSYLIQREEGNIMVDSPRYTESLARKIDEMGGVKYLFLTHRDDVADHNSWRARFNCVRVIHIEEVNYGNGTEDVEMKLEGSGPWNIGSDVDLIFTPGHTEGSVCLHFGGALFSGDHLTLDEDDKSFTIYPQYNRFGVSRQLASVEKLIGLDFVWLLPGHGRRFCFESVEDKDNQLKGLVERERGIRSS